jgi:hypothetical protein
MTALIRRPRAEIAPGAEIGLAAGRLNITLRESGLG